MTTIPVKTGAAYEVRIGSGLLSTCGESIRQIRPYAKAAIITDTTVQELYAQTVADSLEAAGIATCQFAFAPGEGSKTIKTVMDIVGFLSANQMTRTDLIVALGGGIPGDVAGFAASIYLRGIDFVQIPTTFLAAIDSSVGGKTGVNIPEGKNLVGSFYQPRLVLCDTATLDTLSPEVFGDGVAEALKYGCIWDESLFALLEDGSAKQHLNKVIARCVEIKAEVVQQDERDTALRQILNFGHTLGHAIEKASGFEVTHGKAVAIGMVLAGSAGEKAGITAAGTTARIASALKAYGLPTQTQLPLAELCHICGGDKKRSGSKITLVLLEQMGQYRLHPVAVEELFSFMQP